ncbi:NUDIX hydrolase [Pseudactinotalea sp.]|uniref:NUDIX hydrolase n=1 Tax=Pseudactinotalea sp. TaxID=1926260 RepID=UPI003B3AC48A
MLDRFVVVPASYLYLLREGARGPEVLLQLRQGTGYMDGHWAAAAAGHIERGESAPQAAAREATEELGIADVALDFELTMHRTQGHAPIDERVDFLFSARSWSGEPRLMEPDKASELAWCPLAALPEPTVPHERIALAHLGAGTGYLSLGFENAG